MESHNLDILLRQIARISERVHGADNALQLSLHLESESSLLDAVRSLLPTLELTDDEVRVVALLYCGKQWFDTPQPTRSNIPHILHSLRRKGIIEIDPLSQDLIEETPLPPIVFLNKNVLKEADGSNKGSDDSQLFESYRDYLLSWFAHIKRFHQFREYERAHHPIHGTPSERPRKDESTLTATERKFAAEEKVLIKRSLIGGERFPVERVVRQLNLCSNERRILLFVLMNELNSEHCTTEDLLLLTSTDVLDGLDKDRLWKPDSMLRLYDLISIEEARRSRILKTQVTMRSSVKRWLATGEGNVPGITHYDSDPYPNEYAHIEDYLRFGKMWVRLSRLAGANRRNGEDDEADIDDESMRRPSTHPMLASMRARIERKTKASSKKFPIEVLTERHYLSETEKDILILMIEAVTSGRDIDLDDLTLIMTSDPVERQKIEILLSTDSSLVVNGLVNATTRRNGSVELTLPTAIRNYLLGVSDLSEPTVKQLLAGDSLLSVIHPTTTMEDLILPASTMELLQNGLNRYTSKANKLLREWGILTKSGAGGTADDAGSLLVLFSGASGTGKTHAAHCFAGSLGKDILVTDCSKILDYWFGNSEKNVSQLFSTIRSINQRTDNPPVLLLNEADQLLGKRTAHAQHSTDRTYHQIQNLFLENFENYTGILIATTNLIDSLDEAFSRRFDLKVVFPMPDSSARYDLWNLHLPTTAPLADDVDLCALADKYEFSGGQIAVAVKQAATVAAIRGDVIQMADLLAACRAEESGAFDSTSTMRKRQVGFCTPEPELRMKEHTIHVV